MSYAQQAVDTTGPGWIQYGGPCGPSEYSPVATETKPMRDYCAETAAKIAAADAEGAAALAKLPARVPAIRMAHQAGDAVGFERPIAQRASMRWVQAPPPSREDERRAIDTLLREDAKRTPAFATARRAAVLAAADDVDMKHGVKPRPMTPEEADDVVAACRAYEGKRGGMTRPSQAATDYRDTWIGAGLVALKAYERARGMR